MSNELKHPNCPLCDGRTIKSGKQYRKGSIKRGTVDRIVQRYRCKTCGTTFCDGDGYFKGKFPLRVVQYAVSLYLNGLSLEKIQAKLKEELSISVSRKAIGEWLTKANVSPRHGSGDQKSKIVRELIETGITTTIRFASSKQPEKIIVVQNEIFRF